MAGFVSFVVKSRFRNPFRLPDSVPDRRACVFVRVGSSPLPPFFCGRRKMCGLRFVIFVARRVRIGFAGLPGGISAGKRSRFFRRERRRERNLRSALKSGIKRAFYIFGRLNKFKTVCRIDRFVLEKERVFCHNRDIISVAQHRSRRWITCSCWKSGSFRMVRCAPVMF